MKQFRSLLLCLVMLTAISDGKKPKPKPSIVSTNKIWDSAHGKTQTCADCLNASCKDCIAPCYVEDPGQCFACIKYGFCVLLPPPVTTCVDNNPCSTCLAPCGYPNIARWITTTPATTTPTTTTTTTTTTLSTTTTTATTTTPTPIFVVRLPGTPDGGWSVGPGRVDAIEFTSSKDILIHGISMFGSETGTSTLTGLMEMKEGGSVLTSQNFLYTSDGGKGYYDQMFAKQGYARAGVKYTLTVEYSFTPTIWGQYSGGLASTSVICNGATITFKFTDSSDDNNGSGVSSGPMPRIIFTC